MQGHGHQKGMELVSRGNRTANQVAKEEALHQNIVPRAAQAAQILLVPRLPNCPKYQEKNMNELPQREIRKGQKDGGYCQTTGFSSHKVWGIRGCFNSMKWVT